MYISVPVIYYLLTFKYNFIEKERQFREFIKNYNKSYTFFSNEYWHRFAIFQNALDKIDHLNSQRKHQNSALFGPTQFADLTFDEFKKNVINLDVYGFKNVKSKTRKGLLGVSRYHATSLNISNVPMNFDWRTKGIIGDVVAQGECGSCWALSMVDTIASMVALKTNRYVKLSAQQLLDCDTINFGCFGGDFCEGLNWIQDNHVALMTDQEYPYRFESSFCRQPNPRNGVQIYNNFTCQSESGNEQNMIQLIAHHGPLMVAVDASLWQYYVNGTIHEKCGPGVNHAAQIVGYNLEDNIPYYIVRNTWGTDWGMNGYVQVAIGNNTCDIASKVAAVWVK